MKNIFLFLLLLISVVGYAQNPINLKTQTNITDYIGDELKGRLIDTLSTLSDTTAAANIIGRIAHVVDVDQKWTVNSAGSWEALSVSMLSDNVGKYFFSFDEAQLIDGDTLSNEAPNVAYDPNTGRLAMIYRKGTTHGYSAGAKAVVRYSDDNGDNWSDAIDAISFGGNKDVRDPAIFWDDSTSQYIAFGTIVQSETIDSIPEFVVLSRSNDATVWSVTDTIQNPESRAVFRPTTNIVRKGDSLLLTAYFQSLDSVKLYFLQSIDNGVNWTYTIVDADNVTTGPNEGQIVIHSDTMFLFTRAYPNNFFRYYSTDNGATWSLRTDITPDKYNGTNPNIEIVDDSIFVMTHRQSGGGSPVVSLSYDNGLTWTEPDLIPYINGLGLLDYSDFQKINDNLYYHVYSQNDNIRGQLYIRGFGYDANNLSKYRYYTIGESKVLKDGLYYADPNKFRYWIGNDAGSDDSGSVHQVAIGYQAGINNTNQHQNAIGALAGEDNTGIYQTAIGVFAGRDNTGHSQSTVGAFSGSNNTGSAQSALGTYAGEKNIGDLQVALGHRAGQNNSGSKQVVLGDRAGQNNSGSDVIQIGSYAGQNNQSSSQVVIGNEAGRNNTGVYQTAIGIFAGRTNSGDDQVAIGRLAGDLNSGDYGVFLGFSAGRLNTFDNVIAIGRETYPNDSRQIVIGNSTYYDNTIFPQKLTLEDMLVLTPLATANEPTPTEGGMYYNTNDNEVKISKDGLAFEPLVPKDTLIYTFPILPYNGTDTIADQIGFEEYFTTVTPEWANRRVVAFEITTTDTVSTDLYLQLYQEDIVAGNSANPIPPTTNFVLPQGQQSIRFTTADTEIPTQGIEFTLGRALYAEVTNGSAVGSSSYVATEGANGLYITFYLIE